MPVEQTGLSRAGFLVYALLFCKEEEWGLGDLLRLCAKMGVSMGK